MKKTKWLGLLAVAVFVTLSSRAQPPALTPTAGPVQAPPTAAVPTNLSPAAVEVVKLAESGVGEDVILAYIQNSQTSFNLGTDAVLYLRDLGLSSQAITAMLNRDAALHQTQTLPSVTPPPAPQPATPPQTPPEPTNVPGPTYVESPPPTEVNYFYTDLAPYGSWVVLPGYGWCWQPRACAINHAWRPYCDGGHWVYTDCGWCWTSTYSWGWAPFHYGRWVTYPSCGWVWVPGTVWAPAWVSWRVAGDHCGWAPLPPGATFTVSGGWHFNGVSVGVGFNFGLPASSYTFVAVNNFTAPSVAVHALPPTQVTKIYNQTTIINNTTVNNNIIVNKGVAVAQVASVTHSEIRPIKIQEAPAGMSRSTTITTSARNNTVIYRPQLKAPAKPPVVVAQKVDEKNPVIYHQPVSTFGSVRTTTASTRGSAWSSQNTSRPSSSPGRSQFPTRQPNEKPPSYAPSYNAPKTSQAPPPPASASSVAASHVESSDQPKQTADSSAASKSDASPQTSPWRTSSSGSRLGQSSSQGKNSHVYYPKGYYQANEGRSSSSSGQPQSSAPASPSTAQSSSK